MQISAVASAFPEHYYTQQQILDELASYWSEQSERLPALNRFHHRVGVDGRYLAIPANEYRAMDTWGKANDIWITVARKLGCQAINRALVDAGLTKEDIGAIISVSVTGIASPSLDSYLINDMGLPTAVRRIPVFGLGCVAGAAGLAQAAEYVRAYPDRMAVLLSVELCSLTWQREDLSIANMIASGLFGDGAAAVIVTGADFKRKAAGPAILGSQSSFYPGTQDVMGWDISEKGFQIVLSPDVPRVIKENLPRDIDGFLAKHDLKREDICSWVMHTGGPKVLQASAEALGLSEEACAASWECLRKVGNLSSTSVLLVLEDVMKNRRPEPGTYGILAAMGPGFCSELVLLRW